MEASKQLVVPQWAVIPYSNSKKEIVCHELTKCVFVTLDDNLIANILSITLFFASLFISLACVLPLHSSRVPRACFILGLSMGMIALTAISQAILGDNVTTYHL